MEEKHYIGLIQITKDGNVIAEKRLMPKDKPEAEFVLNDHEGIIARAWCNIHGLWVSS